MSGRQVVECFVMCRRRTFQVSPLHGKGKFDVMLMNGLSVLMVGLMLFGDCLI